MYIIYIINMYERMTIYNNMQTRNNDNISHTRGHYIDIIS